MTRILIDVETTTIDTSPEEWGLKQGEELTAAAVVERLKATYGTPYVAATEEGLLDDLVITVTVVPDPTKAAGRTIAEWAEQ